MNHFRWLLLIVVLSAILTPIYLKRQDLRHRLRCRNNLKELATALEMFASSPNPPSPSGRYPLSLKVLLPGGYLKSMPTCPAAGYDTYSPTYRSVTTYDAFTFACGGYHHGQRDRLWYSAEFGLGPD